ncbi:MAG: hypothetical protein KIT57_13490 [Blastocatellales bacterium]|nr:hypothetical protein [Blastocatellales bacterium]
MAMHPLSLHAKTTILTSAITIAVLLATVLLIGVRMAALVREDERDLAQLQALSLAEQISLMPSPRSENDLRRAVDQARRARPNVIAVRVWGRSGNELEEYLTVGDSVALAVPQEARNALLDNRTYRSGDHPGAQSAPVDDTICRVFAPVTERGRVSGAVEIVERLADVPSIVRHYAENAFGLAAVAVALSALATWLSFRYLVYRPLERLLRVITPADSEDSSHRAEDEFGRVSQEYNRMLERVRELTQERQLRQERLRAMVGEATEELQRRNAQLAEANRALWEASRRLSEMERLAAAGQTAAQFAHEVGTPLNTIGIHVELLRTAFGADPEALKRTGIITEQIERIERIVRNMLDRTRSEKSRPKPIDLRALLERICDTTQPTADACSVRLLRSIDESLPPILGDIDRLQQVFINLINNALDAMPEGGELRVSARGCGAEVVVELADTGCGIGETARSRIFDPLYTTKERGTGLGLAIVGQIIAEHGASIGVESVPGAGACFKLRFPSVDAGGERALALAEDEGREGGAE